MDMFLFVIVAMGFSAIGLAIGIWTAIGRVIGIWTANDADDEDGQF